MRCHDLSEDVASQVPVTHFQSVRTVKIDAQSRCQWTDDFLEPAGDHTKGTAGNGVDTFDELLGAGSDGEGAGNVAEHGLRDAGKCGDPLPQGLRKIDLTVHCPRGHCRHFLTRTGPLGKFFDHFLSDQR